MNKVPQYLSIITLGITCAERPGEGAPLRHESWCLLELGGQLSEVPKTERVLTEFRPTCWKQLRS